MTSKQTSQCANVFSHRERKQSHDSTHGLRPLRKAKNDSVNEINGKTNMFQELKERMPTPKRTRKKIPKMQDAFLIGFLDQLFHQQRIHLGFEG